MNCFLTSVLVLSCCCPARSAKWAFATLHEGKATCTGSVDKTDADANFPLLLDSCVLSYSGTPDKAKWTWTKSTCSTTEVERITYTDDKCTIKVGAGDFDNKWAVACTDGRTIDCSAVHDVAMADAYMLAPGKTDPKWCTAGYRVAEKPVVIGACHVGFASGVGAIGLKATCEGDALVMQQHTAMDCSGASTNVFSASKTCAPGYNSNGWLILKSGCGSGDTTANTGDATAAPTAPAPGKNTTGALASSTVGIAKTGLLLAALTGWTIA